MAVAVGMFFATTGPAANPAGKTAAQPAAEFQAIDTSDAAVGSAARLR